ncbi:uncharacterized protein LOC118855861 isoform X2 [Trichosurus vulpecula]|uniref:uncharacterized protein LOC118855861 isoform X2 n=1 Tax=Trichosurus vulpecula TaxID=9337 RepID=UPI00186B0639|nr:uncharacterized protein LOC118855861 isoform X2 [Trichosurus vulpecula]
MDPTPEQEAVGSTECKAQGPSAPHSHPDWGHILRHLARLHKQMVAYTLHFISSLGLLVSSAFLLAIPIIGDLKTIQIINTFIHLHLSFCLFLSHPLFLAGIHWTLSEAMCIMISCIFHNLVLASFVWIFLGRLCFYLISWSLKLLDQPHQGLRMDLCESHLRFNNDTEWSTQFSRIWSLDAQTLPSDEHPAESVTSEGPGILLKSSSTDS